MIDGDGSIIVVGETASPNFPTTLNSYRREITPGSGITSDIFVTKVDLNYNHIFTTYIGSGADDFGRGVDVDTAGNIYITGYTDGNGDFPITDGAYDSEYNGLYDAFVLKLSSNGEEILRSTYLGGIRDDFGLSVKVDPDTNIYVTGYTTEAPSEGMYPSTPDAFNEIYLGNIDGFITKLDKDLQEVIWSGFIGGLQDDFPQDIAIGADSTVYITGLTRSNNYITTDGVLYREYNDIGNSPQHSDIFFTKISKDGREVLLSSVFGGTNGDIAYGIRLDSDNNIYVAGETRSSDLPTTENAPFRELNQGNDQVFTSDAFVAKFNSRADELLFASYLGGESAERAFDLAIDGDKSIYLVGTTSSQNFPITDLAYDRELNDSVRFSDIFISKFDESGDSLKYSSYFGRERSDLAKAVQVRTRNRIVFTGNTSSTFFETTLDAIQVASQDSLKTDAHFVEFLLDDIGDADVTICKGDSVVLSSDITSTTTTLFFNWSPEESLDDPTKEFPIATPEISTIYTCIVSNTFGEKFIAEVVVQVVDNLGTQISGPLEVNNGQQYLYSSKLNEGSFYDWSVTNGTINSGQGTNNVFVTWSNAEFGSLQLIETNSNGCSNTSTIFTDFSPELRWEVFPFGDYIFCEGDTILLDSGPNFTDVVWQDGVTGRYDTVYTSGIYSFAARNPNGTIFNSEEAEIEFLEKPRKPTIIYSDKSNQLVCISAAETYYWYKEEELIEGENTRFLDPRGAGCYQVSIQNLDSCINRSDDFCYDPTNVEYQFSSKIYPNPSNGIIEVRLESNKSKNELIIYNSVGRKVEEFYFYSYFGSKINLKEKGRGVYYIYLNQKPIEKVVIY